MRRRVRAVPLLSILLPWCAACSSPPPSSTPSTRTALVTEKLMPTGKLVAVAATDGTIGQASLPADLVPDEAVTDVAPIRCLVAAQGLPKGTVLRRSQFVEPAALGLEGGLAESTFPPGLCR